MNTQFLSAAATLGLGLASVTAQTAPSLDSISQYGVYAKGALHYVKVAPLKHLELDYPWYAEIPFVERNGSKLELVIYAKDFKAQEIAFELSPMSNHAIKRPITGHISPLSKADTYQVSFDADIAAENVLLVHQGHWFDGRTGVIALGKPEESLTKALADPAVPVYARFPSLEQLLKVYPQHQGLKALHDKTQHEMAMYEDDKAYGYINEYYQGGLAPHKFEQAAGEIRYYLQQFPAGRHVTEAKSRLAAIEARQQEANKAL